MQLLYNSDSYSVVQLEMPAGEGAASRGGFELVDKRARREAFIEGPVADSFRQGVQALNSGSPSVEDFDDYIAGYLVLATQPLLMH